MIKAGRTITRIERKAEIREHSRPRGGCFALAVYGTGRSLRIVCVRIEKQLLSFVWGREEEETACSNAQAGCTPPPDGVVRDREIFPHSDPEGKLYMRRRARKE